MFRIDTQFIVVKSSFVFLMAYNIGSEVGDLKEVVAQAEVSNNNNTNKRVSIYFTQ